MELKPLVRKELVYKSSRMRLDDFLQEIDSTGGWPLGYTHCSFFRAVAYEGRICQFTTHPVNTVWCTTVCSSDDYYYWKLSDAKKAYLLKTAKR